MKKFVLLIIVLLNLALFSEVMAGNYCTIDDYGCYIFNEDNQQTYIMFWSEAGRKAIMGDTGSSGDLVVDKPAFSSNRLPLDPDNEGEGSTSNDVPAVDTPCVETYNYFKSTDMTLSEHYVLGNAADEAKCQDLVSQQPCFVCVFAEYPTTETFFDIKLSKCSVACQVA